MFPGIGRRVMSWILHRLPPVFSNDCGLMVFWGFTSRLRCAIFCGNPMGVREWLGS
jgi:hypothetical protein